MITYGVTQRPTVRGRRGFAALSVVAVVFMVFASVLVAFASSASAHGKTGKISVEKTTKNDDGTTTLEIAIIFDGDGDPAPDAAVTVVAENVDALKVGPVRMTRVSGSPGSYAATIALDKPGQWELRFTSLTPEAYLETNVTVDAATTTDPSSGPTTDSATTSTSLSTTPSTTRPTTPPPTSSAPGTSDPNRTVSQPASRSSSASLFVGFALAAGAALAAVFWVVRRRRQP